MTTKLFLINLDVIIMEDEDLVEIEWIQSGIAGIETDKLEVEPLNWM